MRKKTMPLPVYCGKLTIYESTDLNEVAKKVGANKKAGGYHAFFTYKVHKNKDVEYVLAFQPNPKESTVAHECVHMVNEVFMDHNIRLDPENDEPYAYFMGWAVNECHKFLKKRDLN